MIPGAAPAAGGPTPPPFVWPTAAHPATGGPAGGDEEETVLPSGARPSAQDTVVGGQPGPFPWAPAHPPAGPPAPPAADEEDEIF
jgi:hypothetical protein